VYAEAEEPVDAIRATFEAAAAIAVKIGDAIKQYNSAELCRVDVLADARTTWTKVRQLTGRSKAANSVGYNAVTAGLLNDHYAAISDDASYTVPCVKSTVNNSKHWKSYH
jgi:hypothetical protein